MNKKNLLGSLALSILTGIVVIVLLSFGGKSENALSSGIVLSLIVFAYSIFSLRRSENIIAKVRGALSGESIRYIDTVSLQLAGKELLFVMAITDSEIVLSDKALAFKRIPLGAVSGVKSDNGHLVFSDESGEFYRFKTIDTEKIINLLTK